MQIPKIFLLTMLPRRRHLSSGGHSPDGTGTATGAATGVATGAAAGALGAVTGAAGAETGAAGAETGAAGAETGAAGAETGAAGAETGAVGVDTGAVAGGAIGAVTLVEVIPVATSHWRPLRKLRRCVENSENGGSLTGTLMDSI
jgi:hypothetical protein